MKKLFFLASLLVFSTSMAFAEPLDSIDTSILEYSEDKAALQVTWNFDESVQRYEVGCVSCMPNTIEQTSENSIVVYDVSALPNSSMALLYVIAYDSNDEVYTAKQVVVELKQ